MTTQAERLTRRGFLTMAGLSVGALTLPGCGADDASTGSQEAVAFTFANWATTPDVFQDIIADYEKEKNLKVVQQATVPFDDYQTRFRTLLAGGSPPDVMRMNDDYVRELSLKGHLKDLRPLIEESKLDTGQLIESLWKFGTQPDGAHTAVPVGVQPRLFYYNKSLFEKAGATLPPTKWTPDGWKWADFLATAKELTAPGKQWGTVIYTDPGYENTFSVNNGGEGLYSADGKRFALADPEGIDAIQWVADLTLVHKVQPPWSQLQADNAELELFAQGKVGMLFATSGTAAYLAENVKDFEWDVTPVPAQVNQSQEGSLIVFVLPAQAKKVDEAWDFLTHMVGPEVGKVFVDANAFIPINKAAAADFGKGEGGPEHGSLFAEAAAHNVAVNFTASTSQAVQIFRPELDRVYNGEASAKEVLEAIRPQVEAALAAE